MTNQTYQEVSDIIEEDLKRLKKLGVKTLGEIINIHKSFYDRRQRRPERYERLRFDNNGHNPFSKYLESILTDFRRSGILRNEYDIIQ